MNLWSRIFGTDAEIESVSRRAFLRGMTVTAAGLIVPLPAIVLPAEQPHWVHYDWQDGSLFAIWRSDSLDCMPPEVLDALRDGMAYAR